VLTALALVLANKPEAVLVALVVLTALALVLANKPATLDKKLPVLSLDGGTSQNSLAIILALVGLISVVGFSVPVGNLLQIFLGGPAVNTLEKDELEITELIKAPVSDTQLHNAEVKFAELSGLLVPTSLVLALVNKAAAELARVPSLSSKAGAASKNAPIPPACNGDVVLMR
jgi:hypothetical protein